MKLSIKDIYNSALSDNVIEQDSTWPRNFYSNIFVIYIATGTRILRTRNLIFTDQLHNY